MRESLKKGGITLYASLALAIVLSLVITAFYSARIAASRVVLSSALEQGLFSLFSEYDSRLFARYGLLFLDGGRGGSEFAPGALLSAIEEYADKVADPVDAGRDGPVTIRGLEAELAGYTLATDDAYAAFSRQICTVAKEKLLVEGLASFTSRLTEHGALAEQLANGKDAAKNQPFTEADAGRAALIDLGEDYADPREAVKAVRKMGLMTLTISPERGLSAAFAEGTPSSRRQLSSGFGFVEGAARPAGEKILSIAYALEMLPSYTEPFEETGLQYQVEYLISGKLSDADNLKSTLYRILAIREASNLIYLSTDPIKRAESIAAATAVCAVLLSPELIPAVALAIRAAWAYAEGMLDIRTLLSGGRVPLIMTSANWQLSVGQLPNVATGVAADTEGSGLNYEDYLAILLLSVGKDKLTMRIADMVEHTMQAALDEPSFRIDNCVDACTVELSGEISAHRIASSSYYAYGAK